MVCSDQIYFAGRSIYDTKSAVKSIFCLPSYLGFDRMKGRYNAYIHTSLAVQIEQPVKKEGVGG